VPLAALPRQFARRMLPAAIAAGLTLALLPPLGYLAQRGLEEQATLYARHFATALQASAFAQPRLWRYDLPKVVQATAAYQGQQDIGSVEVRDCRGQLVFGPGELRLGTGRASGPSGSAAVVVHGRQIAEVRVVMDPGRPRARALRIAAVSLLLGLGLALFLLLYPTRVVRGQAGQLHRTLQLLREAEQQLRAANRRLEQQVVEAVEKVRALSARVVEVQEEERARIARDLHDGVGQALTALQIDLRLAMSQPEQASGHLEQATRLVEEALAETRRAVADLRPGELERLGLPGALRSCVEGFEARTGVSTAFRVAGSLEGVPAEVARALFRILQEALTNVSRHAGASEVGVVVERRQEGIVCLTVQDDGRGFDPGGQLEREGGLRGVRERAEFCGGRAEILSVPGEGARIEVQLPLLRSTSADPDG